VSARSPYHFRLLKMHHPKSIARHVSLPDDARLDLSRLLAKRTVWLANRTSHKHLSGLRFSVENRRLWMMANTVTAKSANQNSRRFDVDFAPSVDTVTARVGSITPEQNLGGHNVTDRHSRCMLAEVSRGA